ncbi:Cys-tRNA(Pro) deacylase [Aeromonas cavernicola]|uniref:Cys-tRNA(Pro)/Cys-tRNA(Cys) deacylase n=1 Tax=Aeromonas cavernicola TaxID=1006623 RepID=A0A2H9U544_9GAMM|nr:Cys-tRNA(Pro) deacylase [Aeromonas cavernicola]PJG59131.1 Cys-tRNA(Pro) deacylase [Aeromonas cavernicola]
MTPAINLLKQLNIPYTLYPYPCDAHDDFGKHAATQLGLPLTQVFKTLIAYHDKQAVVAIVPSSGLCNLKQLAKATGLKKVEMMKPADAEKLTGYKVGGISPLAQKKGLPTVLDDSAMQFTEILVSGGKRGLSVGVSPHAMERLLKWVVAPIGEPHP